MSDVVSIRHQQELLVYGYVRSIDQIDNIPDELTRICLSFYRILFDTWDPKETSSDGYKINKEENSVTALMPYKQAFGQFFVQKGQVQDWTIRGKDPADGYLIAVFGITDVENRSDGFQGYYGYDGCFFCDNRAKKYGKSWTSQDTLTATLDMATNDEYGTLSFKVNGEDRGIANKTIDLNNKYCMTITIPRNCTVNMINIWP